MPHIILRRFLALIPLILAASLVIFLMLRLGPSDPVLSYLRISRIPPTPEAMAEARHMLGLDRPLAGQYLDWLIRAARLDFGTSFMTGRDVAADLLHYLPNTLLLAAAAFLFTLAVSLPLGIWAARHPDGLPDHAVRLLAWIGVSMPNFWLGFLLVLVFSVWLGWLPPMGMAGPSSLILPVLALSLMSISINARLLRASMLDTRAERHVTWARLRGLPPGRIERAHVLRNAILPVVTASGMHIGELIGGALIIESVFSWPGVGRYVIQAINSHDYPVIQCFTLAMVVVFVFANLLVDLICLLIDPRIRAKTGGVS